MEHGSEQEFYMAFVIWGGIILAGTLVSIALGFLIVARYKHLKKSKLIKEINEQARENGKAR